LLEDPRGGIAAVSIGGSTFTYNLNVASQYLAYEHAVVHNDLVGQFQSDKTGALRSAVTGIPRTDANGQTQPTLDKAGAKVFATANASNAAATSIPPRDWNYGGAGGCTTTSAFKRAALTVRPAQSSVRSTSGVTAEVFTGDTAIFVDYVNEGP